MTCEKRCRKRLEGWKRVKHLARLFVRAKTQVDECFSVVFHKDAILEISPVQGSEFLHHPANMLLVLCRVCCLHDIPIGGNDHLECLFCSRGQSCLALLYYISECLFALVPNYTSFYSVFQEVCKKLETSAIEHCLDRRFGVQYGSAETRTAYSATSARDPANRFHSCCC